MRRDFGENMPIDDPVEFAQMQGERLLRESAGGAFLKAARIIVETSESLNLSFAAEHSNRRPDGRNVGLTLR